MSTAFGIWYDTDQTAYLVDSSGQKLSLIEARTRLHAILVQRERDELVAMLTDRLDAEDLIGFLTGADGKFLAAPPLALHMVEPKPELPKVGDHAPDLDINHVQ